MGRYTATLSTVPPPRPSAAADSEVTNPIALPGPKGTSTTRFRSPAWLGGREESREVTDGHVDGLHHRNAREEPIPEPERTANEIGVHGEASCEEHDQSREQPHAGPVGGGGDQGLDHAREYALGHAGEPGDQVEREGDGQYRHQALQHRVPDLAHGVHPPRVAKYAEPVHAPPARSRIIASFPLDHGRCRSDSAPSPACWCWRACGTQPARATATTFRRTSSASWRSITSRARP